MKATRLRTSSLANPTGIDILNPTFSWIALGGLRQSAYHLVAKRGEEIIFDSGKVVTNSMQCLYKGKALQSRDQVSWNVALFDENDIEGEPSETATFEMGFLKKEDWSAKWIRGDYKPEGKKPFIAPYMGKFPPRNKVDYFKKTFIVKDIKEARLYITALGLYEAYINGHRVGDFVMAPGYTDYTKRVQYQTYDVAALLKEGENVIEVKLGSGWYRGSCGAWGIWCQYGTVTKLLAQLEITKKDDMLEKIVTDKSWKWSNDGSLIFADNKDGEEIDARLTPSYKGKVKESKHKIIPSASNNTFVKEHETFIPTLSKTPSGKILLSFPQNLAGFLSFKVQAKAGQKLSFRCGEIIGEDGELTQKNIQLTGKGRVSCLQRVDYVAKEGINEFKNTFSVFGFQYVEVTTDIEVKADDFKAIAVYTDMESVGTFESSNPLLNQFVENTRWSAKNNFLDIPTDCPTRERHGWTGDIQIFYKTGSYLLDCNSFIKKYLNDVFDWQKRNGKLPHIAPMGGSDFFMNTMNGSVGWSDASILIPYRMWKTHGDKAILEKHYEGMKKFASFMIKRIGGGFDISSLFAKKIKLPHKDKKNIVNRGQSYGEWAEPTDVYVTDWKDIAAPHAEVSTAYTSYDLKCMAEIAHELGHLEDEKCFLKYSERCKKGYQALRHSEGFTFETKRPAELIRPLYMDLLSEEDKKTARIKLAELIKDYGYRLGTGFLSTPLILFVLAEFDLDLAYKVLENEEMPGWLFMPKMGATTIWESWEGKYGQGGIASLNHYSKGAVVEWLFEGMCGIKVLKENEFLIKPLPGGNFEFAKASFLSHYGLVKSGWRKEGGNYHFEIEIPSNTKATLILPNSEVYQLNPGTYKF